MARFVKLMNKSQSNKASLQITYAIIMFRAENIDRRVDRKARSQMFAQSRKVEYQTSSIEFYETRAFCLFRQKSRF